MSVLGGFGASDFSRRGNDGTQEDFGQSHPVSNAASDLHVSLLLATPAPQAHHVQGGGRTGKLNWKHPGRMKANTEQHDET